jgi:hypothetical protein
MGYPAGANRVANVVVVALANKMARNRANRRTALIAGPAASRHEPGKSRARA